MTFFGRMVAADTKRNKAPPPPMYCTCVLEEDVLTGQGKVLLNLAQNKTKKPGEKAKRTGGGYGEEREAKP